MGIYIKGMNKPKDCYNCRFNESNLSCFISKGRIDSDDCTCEFECPIVEVKEPHGDLIDRDRAIDGAKVDGPWAPLAYEPAVIEAEGSE